MENQIKVNLTEDSKALFIYLVKDAGNWSGQPLVNISKEKRGNLTQLKRQKLVRTVEDEGCVFAYFTQKGKDFAIELGLVEFVDSLWVSKEVA